MSGFNLGWFYVLAALCAMNAGFYDADGSAWSLGIAVWCGFCAFAQWAGHAGGKS